MLDNALSDLLSCSAEEIASVRVLDPACGSGNILSVSMQQLPNSGRGHHIRCRSGTADLLSEGGPEQVHGVDSHQVRQNLPDGIMLIVSSRWTNASCQGGASSYVLSGGEQQSPGAPLYPRIL
jgi:hypothetical protein